AGVAAHDGAGLSEALPQVVDEQCSGLDVVGVVHAVDGDPDLCHKTSSRPQHCGGEHITPPIMYRCNEPVVPNSRRLDTEGEQIRDRGSRTVDTPQKRSPAALRFSLSE